MSDGLFAQYREASGYYAANWQAIDLALYDLCRKHPDHQRPDGVHAKLNIIGRTYATGIERAVRSRKYQGSAMESLCRHFWSCRHDLDMAMRPLASIGETLTLANLNDILTAHGKVVSLILPALRPNRTPRSFVSKYLHFHCPAVPIYDSVADHELKRLIRWCSRLEVIPLPKDADERYGKFCLRFWQLLEQLRQSGDDVSVKLMDNFILWQERERQGVNGGAQP